MHFSLATVALVAAELGSVAAAPHQLAKREIVVNRVAAGPKTRNALKSMRYALQKFGVEVPQGMAEADETLWDGKYVSDCGEPMRPQPSGAAIQQAAASSTDAAPMPSASPSGQAGAGQGGNVTNKPVMGELEWVAEITVGGQKMGMDFDTGSSDLWLFSTEMPEEERPSPHVAFDQTKSKTFKKIDGATFSVKFGDGSTTQGQTVGTDDVEIGGVTAKGQTVELANKVANQFVKDVQSNGLVGLGFSKINNVKPNKAKTFLDTIKDQIPQPILAANLRHNSPGSYTFGKVDNGSFKGDLKTVPVDDSRGFWQFQSTKFAVGDEQPQTNQGGKPAIADTGTTLMLVDKAVAQAYYAKVDGAQVDSQTGMHVFPCNAKNPDFHVAFGDNMATVPADIIKYQTLDQQTGGGDGGQKKKKRDLIIEIGGDAGDDSDDAADPGSNGPGGQDPSQMCVGGIQETTGTPVQIYGDIFFKAQYAVFNLGDKTVGFAPHA